MGNRTIDPTDGPIQFPFNERKALAASTHLLARAGGRMPYMRLVKLLYLADRASFLEYGHPITGDRYVAMKLGPVLSTVYDRIKEGEWGGLIRKVRYDVRLVGSEWIDPLSEAEIDILDDVSGFCEKLDHWKISNLTHELPEWKKAPNKINGDISVESILKALGKAEHDIAATAEESREQAFFEEVFSDP